MKDFKKSLTSGNEKLPLGAVRKEKDVASSSNKGNETESLAGKSKKKEEKGDDIMSMEEDFKVFMREEDKRNKRLDVFFEGFLKREEQQAQGTRIEKEVKSALDPLGKKVEQQGKVLQELQNKLEPFGEVCTSVEECKKQLKKFQEVAATGEGKGKTLDDFSAQDKYDSIKKAPVALADLDNIYVARFAENPEYRKLALEKLSPQTFIEMVKNKEIDDKLTGMCQDEACRIDIIKRIKQVEKSTGKKLL